MTEEPQQPSAAAAQTKTTNTNTPVRRKNKTNSKSTTPKHRAELSAVLITFVVVVLAVFFGAQFFMKAGVFKEPGKIVFADTASELNQDFVNTNLAELGELNLSSDIEIGAVTATKTLETASFATQDDTAKHNDNSALRVRRVLYDITLPVISFTDPATTITVDAAKQGNLVSVWDLNDEQKLLALTDESGENPVYYLDSFDGGAFFNYLVLTGKNTEEVDRIADLLASKVAALPNRETVFTLAQTGVTALSRRMYSKLQQVGDATYFSQKIAPFLSKFDLTHTSNESSFSSLANGSNICSAPAMIDVLTNVGIDIVELTGNHNQDCGDEDAIATITQYHDLGMQTFGGGITAEAAAIPLQISEKNTNVTLLGYNLSTGGYTLDATPGANFYTEEKARADIAAAKERGDFIIVDIQYYECNEYVDTNENTICDAADSSAGDQVGFFRSLIDMGADIVVGTSAHQPQTFEQYHDGTIYYGLGNLFFDQSAWPGTTRSLVLVHYFWEGKLLQTRIVPTIYDNNFQTALMDTAAAEKFLQRLFEVQPTQN